MPARLLEFDEFSLDCDRYELLRSGRPVKLEKIPMELLILLVTTDGRLVTRQEIIEHLWGTEVFVDTEHGINTAIRKIRNVLRDDHEQPRFIQTIPRKGYRFIATIKVIPQERGNGNPNGMELVPPETTQTPADGQVRSPLPQSHYPVGGVRQKTALVLVGAIGIVAILVGLNVRGVRGRLFAHAGKPRIHALALLPLGSGLKVVPITSSSGASAPAFSPDGKEIAFLWDGGGGNTLSDEDSHLNREIYVKWIGEGAPLRLTSSPGDKSGPVWSPDGRHIAFVRRNQRAGIYMVSALGGPEYQIAVLNSLPGEYHSLYRQTDWSPDGKFLAVADHPTAEQPGIFLVSAVSGEKQRLTIIASPWNDTAPTFSPDGKIVAFVRANDIEQDIYEVPITGGEPHRLTYVNKPIGGAFSWTPNGKEIVFSTYGEGEGHCSLWRVSATGGQPERLPFDAADEALEPVVSRQQNFLAFTRLPTNVNIWKLELSGFHTLLHPPTKLIASTRVQSGPQFSPDGKRILFASDRTGKMDLWVCDADGSNPVQVTSLGTAGTPRWSPDGQQIVFDSPDSGVFGIYVVNVDGGAPRKIVVDSHSNAIPSWSRNGRWIYFASDRSGSDQIWKVSPNGGAPIQVTQHGGLLGLESLDGKFLYYKDRPEPSGIWRISPEGGKEVLILKQPVNIWYWTVGKDGLYFIDSSNKGRATVKFWSFASRQTTTLATLAESPWPHDPALAVSPDSRSILYDQQDNVTSDIMLVENFR